MHEYIDVKELKDLYMAGKKLCVWGAGYLAKTTCKDILKKLEMTPFCFCDNNSSLYGTIVYDDIKCLDYHDLNDINKDNIVWILSVRFALQRSIYEQLKKMGYRYIIPLTSLSCDSGVLRKYFPFMEEKVVAYTCIVGNYDEIHYPSDELAHKYDYVLISDSKPSEMKTFKEWIDIHDVCPGNITDPTMMNRYCKINAHTLFPKYDRSIYMDGNIQLKRDLDLFLGSIPNIGIIMLSSTGYIDIYREAAHKMSQTVENTDTIYNQIRCYWDDGMPEYFGSWHCGIMIRKHNSMKCRQIMDDWWCEITKFSKRDQLSFPYVMWKRGYSARDVMTILKDTDNLENNEYYTLYHDHLRKID